MDRVAVRIERGPSVKLVFCETQDSLGGFVAGQNLSVGTLDDQSVRHRIECNLQSFVGLRKFAGQTGKIGIRKWNLRDRSGIFLGFESPIIDGLACQSAALPFSVKIVLRHHKVEEFSVAKSTTRGLFRGCHTSWLLCGCIGSSVQFCAQAAAQERKETGKGI